MHKTKDRVTRIPLQNGFFTIYQLIIFYRLFFSKYSTTKIKIWQHYLLGLGIRPDDNMTVIHLIHFTCWPYHFTLGPFTRSKFSIKNLVKVLFNKVFWLFKPASKTFHRTLIEFYGFDRIEIPSYYYESFGRLWWELINQASFLNHFVCLLIYSPKVVWDKNTDQTFTHFDRGNRIPLIKFPLSKFPFKTFDQIVDEQFDRVNRRLEKIIGAMN